MELARPSAMPGTRFSAYALRAAAIGVLLLVVQTPYRAVGQGVATTFVMNGNCCPQVACALPVYSGKRVALVIGDDEYGSPPGSTDSPANLRNAGRDAQSMARLLAQGYVVRCVVNANKTQVYRELALLNDYLQRFRHPEPTDFDDNGVVVFFAGHGFRTPEGEFILPSGNYAPGHTPVAAGRIAISQLALALPGEEFFNIFIILDACRNEDNGQLIKPAWAQGFDDISGYATGSKTFVFSAGYGGFAFDRSDAIHAVDNGAFVFEIKKYAELLGLSFQDLAEVVRADIGMHTIGQRPVHDGLPPNQSWSGFADTCSSIEARVALAAASCHTFTGTNLTSCLNRRQHACSELSELTHAQEIVDGRKKVCNAGKVESIFPELLNECSVQKNPPQVAVLQSNPNSSLMELRRQDILTSAQTLWATALEKVRQAAAKVRPLQFQRLEHNLRTTLLQSARRKLNGSGFTPESSAVWNVPNKALTLSVLPTAKAGSTGPLQPTGPVRVDCEGQPCDDKWVMVRVPVQGGAVDGWLDASEISLRPADATVVLKYEGNSIRAKTDPSLNDVAMRLKSGRALAEVDAVIPGPADAVARSLAEARVAVVVNSLSASSGDNVSVSSRIIETQNADAVSAVSILLFDLK